MSWEIYEKYDNEVSVTYHGKKYGNSVPYVPRKRNVRAAYSIYTHGVLAHVECTSLRYIYSLYICSVVSQLDVLRMQLKPGILTRVPSRMQLENIS